MQVRNILIEKGTDVITIHQTESIAAATRRLAQEDIGALVVTEGTGDDEAVVGILSERDIVRTLAARGAQTLELQVGDVMEDQTLICDPEDDIERVATMMSQHRVRHLPVMKDHRVRGLVSIRDVLEARR
jgi:CBS domain-containing protein